MLKEYIYRKLSYDKWKFLGGWGKCVGGDNFLYMKLMSIKMYNWILLYMYIAIDFVWLWWWWWCAKNQRQKFENIIV